MRYGRDRGLRVFGQHLLHNTAGRGSDPLREEGLEGLPVLTFLY